MKTGIYVPGLGESFRQESVIKYATRLMHEMDANADNPAITFSTKVENVEYSKDCRSVKVSIISQFKGIEKTAYVFYDFQYANFLTASFTSASVLKKSWLVFLTVVGIFPLTVWRIFVPGEMRNYNFRLRFQSFYAFFIFLLISAFGLLLIPASVSMLTELAKLEKGNLLSGLLAIPGWLTKLSAVILSVSTFVFTLAPSYRLLMTSLATEFVCVNYYLRVGDRRQMVTGSLLALVEYIAQNDPDCEIHLHTYSFGAIVGIDSLFPFGTTVANRVKQKVKALITIACPYEFLSNYYTEYFKERDEEMTRRLHRWYNVYSNSDALASNFRHGNVKGNAEYSFLQNKVFLPKNIYYELANIGRFSWLDYLTLYSIKAHQLYWDTDPRGSSCMLVLYNSMVADNILPLLNDDPKPENDRAAVEIPGAVEV